MLAKRRLLGFGRDIRLRLGQGASTDATALGPRQGARQRAEDRSITSFDPDQRDYYPAGILSAGDLPARFGEN